MNRVLMTFRKKQNYQQVVITLLKQIIDTQQKLERSIAFVQGDVIEMKNKKERGKKK